MKRLAVLALLLHPGSPHAEPLTRPLPVEIVRDASGQITDAGRWNVHRSTDPMTDERRVSLAISAINDDGTTRRGNMMVFLCTERYIVFSIEFERLRTAQYGLTASLRFDRGPVRSEGLPVGSDGQSVAANIGYALLQELRGASRFAVRVTDEAGRPHTNVYDVTGLSEVLAEVPTCSTRPTGG